MGRPRKPPAFLVEATVRGSTKLAELPSDSARLGYFYVVLAEAKVAKVPGEFASKGHFREISGRFSRYLDDYISVGILEVAPRLCDRCKTRHQPSRAGALVVHDWHEHQYDVGKVERQRVWDEVNRGPVSDGVSDAQSDAVSDAVSDAQSDVVSDASSRAPTRSGARSPGVNVNVNRERERLSPEEDRSSQVPPDRPDVAYLKSIGWKRVTAKQLELLDEIADRHDRPSKGEAWGTYAASVMAGAPEDADPIAHLRSIDDAWQSQRRDEIAADEARLAQEKAQHEADAKAFSKRYPNLFEQPGGQG